MANAPADTQPIEVRLAALGRRMDQHLGHDPDRPTWLHWSDARMIHQASAEIMLRDQIIEAQRLALSNAMNVLARHKEGMT